MFKRPVARGAQGAMRGGQRPKDATQRCHRGRALRVLLAAGVCALMARQTPDFVVGRSSALQLQSAASPSKTARSAVVDEPKVGKRTSVANEWRMNVGHAIDVLRTDIVDLFERRDGYDRMDFSIYHEDIEVEDARAPQLRLHGLNGYRNLLQVLHTTLRTSCQRRKLELVSIGSPVNNQVRIRWRLKLVPFDVFAPAKGFLQSLPSLRKPSFWDFAPTIGQSFVVDGYSTYTFDAWSAQIVKHTIEVTNPPLYINDLIQQYSNAFNWPGARVVRPQMWPQAALNPALVQAPTTHSLTDGGSGGTVPGFPTNAVRNDNSKVSRQAFPDWMSFLPEGCEDDYECNDGKANFPLQCCELPVLGRFCCEPDNAVPIPSQPSFVPLPVPVEDPLTKQNYD
mmetsp:Transcript_45536/g.105558  ORF Transcript_45536/g.105558 Transcript_45536/m.105558 type:complete len:396 (-) Transcript_45536:95-1282(-)